MAVLGRFNEDVDGAGGPLADIVSAVAGRNGTSAFRVRLRKALFASAFDSSFIKKRTHAAPPFTRIFRPWLAKLFDSSVESSVPGYFLDVYTLNGSV